VLERLELKLREENWHGGRLVVGPGMQWCAGGVWIGEAGPMTCGPQHNPGGFKNLSDSNQVQMNSNSIQFVSKFNQPKKDLP
jgi:hypothetical protein